MWVHLWGQNGHCGNFADMQNVGQSGVLCAVVKERMGTGIAHRATTRSKGTLPTNQSVTITRIHSCIHTYIHTYALSSLAAAYACSASSTCIDNFGRSLCCTARSAVRPCPVFCVFHRHNSAFTAYNFATNSICIISPLPSQAIGC